MGRTRHRLRSYHRGSSARRLPHFGLSHTAAVSSLATVWRRPAKCPQGAEKAYAIFLATELVRPRLRATTANVSHAAAVTVSSRPFAPTFSSIPRHERYFNDLLNGLLPSAAPQKNWQAGRPLRPGRRLLPTLCPSPCPHGRFERPPLPRRCSSVLACAGRTLSPVAVGLNLRMSEDFPQSDAE